MYHSLAVYLILMLYNYYVSQTTEGINKTSWQTIKNYIIRGTIYVLSPSINRNEIEINSFDLLILCGKEATEIYVSIPSSGSIQFLQRRFQVIVEQSVARSKKTAMVKGGLRGWGAYFLTLFN